MKYLINLLSTFHSTNKYKEVEKIIDYRFHNKALLKKALTHKSSNNSTGENYERLEFLGDSIIDFLVCEFIYKEYPYLDEGKMSKLKSLLVNKTILSKSIECLDLKKYINKGDNTKLTKSFKKNIFCNIFESITASIYLDSDILKAKSFLYNYHINKIDLDLLKKTNYKGDLIELCQKNNYSPSFNTIKTLQYRNNVFFRIKLVIKNNLSFYGIGLSKKEAEQNASKIALNYLNHT